MGRPKAVVVAGNAAIQEDSMRWNAFRKGHILEGWNQAIRFIRERHPLDADMADELQAERDRRFG